MAEVIADFTTQDKFNPIKSYTQVKFGSSGKVLEVELNEMQKIMTYRDLLTNKMLIADGFVNMNALTVSGGVLTLAADTVVAGGSIHEILEAMTISVSSGDNIYLAVTSAEVSQASTVHKSGNLSGGTIITSEISDPRMQGLETTRRIQEQVQLVKSNTGSDTYIHIATMTSATAFTDRRTKCFMHMQDANHRLVTDTQITTWVDTATNYAAHAADHTGHIYYGGTTSGSANAYTVTTAPAPTELEDGMAVRCKINIASTADATLNWQSLGTFPIKDAYGNNVSDLSTNIPYTFIYESTNQVFILTGRGGGGTAIASHLLLGDTATTRTGPIVGTMPDNGAVAITPGTVNQTISLGYHNGVGYVAGDTDLVSANIKAGITIFGISGKTSVVETSDATATAAQILLGATAYVNGVKITGTIASKAAATYTPGTANQTIAAGQYLSGIQTITGDVDLVTANIKSGVTIFGVAGKTSVVETSDATAAAAQILTGYTAYINGVKVTGTIPNKGSATYTPTTSAQTIAAGQYLSGIQTIAGDANLVAANIKSGVTIFGVAGNSNVVDTSAGTATAAQILSGAIAYVDGVQVTGTMIDRSVTGADTIRAGDSRPINAAMSVHYDIYGNTSPTNKLMMCPPVGFYPSAATTSFVYAEAAEVAGALGITSDKVKAGVTICGITGNGDVVDTSAGTATAAQILAGQVAYVDGAQVTGTMVNRPATANDAAWTGTGDTDPSGVGRSQALAQWTGTGALFFKPAAGYYDGSTSWVYRKDANFISANIKAGITIFGVAGKTSVVETSDATAAAAQILTGYTAYINGVKVTGTIPNKGAATYTPTTTDQTIAAAQYLSGVQTIKGDANLIAANIKSGVTIFGVAGNSNVVDTSGGTATAAQILSGAIAYVDGVQVTGTITSKAAATYTPGTTNQTIAAGQYLSGAQTIAGDANLIAANIKSGVSIFGVAGNSNVVDTSAGTATAAQILSGAIAYVDGVQVTGTMVNHSVATLASEIVTLTNMLNNSSFEPDKSSWSGGSLDSTYKKFGANSCKITNATGSLNHPVTIVNTHKYYASGWFMRSASISASAQLDIPISGAELDFVTISNTNLPSINTWYMLSGVVTAASSVSNNLRAYSNDTTANIYVDGVTFIDLTAAFGAGNEPTQSQMDAIMNTVGGWFEGSTIVAGIAAGGYVTNGATGNPDIVTVDTSLVSANIKSGVTIFGIAGKASVVDTADATLTAPYMLTGYTAYVNGVKVSGTMSNKGAETYTPTTTDQTISAGQYLSGVQTIAGSANLIAANIKAGITIFGVAGNSNVVDTSAGTATAAQILSGAIAYVDGAAVTGTIASKTAATYTPGTTNQTIAAGQYLSGAQTIAGAATLISANIKSGVSIFGVAGNSNVVDTSAGTATAGQILSGAVAYVDGAAVTGTMIDRSSANWHQPAVGQTVSDANGYGAYLIPPAGYYNGSSWVRSLQPDLVASNIISGKNIFGIAGTASITSLGGRRFATGSQAPTGGGAAFTGLNGTVYSNFGYITVTGLSFKPSFIYAKAYGSGTTYIYSYEEIGVESYPKVMKFCTFNTGHTSSAVAYNFKGDVGSASVVTGSFTLPANVNYTVTWIAIE